jgi:uncharacterized protein (DUF2141 family)
VRLIGRFRDEEEAIRRANDSPFALSASVWTGSRPRGRRVAGAMCAGSCAVNDVIRVIANPGASFGGNRLSGHGRYHGPDGLRSFSRTKTIMLARDRRAREIHWFPCTERTQRQLAALLRWRHRGISLAARLSRVILPLLAFALWSPCPRAQSAAEAHLTIDVRLRPGAHGEAAYLIFNSSRGFPSDRDKALRRGFVPIPAAARSLHIEADLPPGTYAVSMYEDSNTNHKLDRTFLGVPTEPVGASNNPASRMGPPRFSDCVFRLGAGPQSIHISLGQGL